MEAMPQPTIDHGAALARAPDVADGIAPAKPVSLADANSAGIGKAPPHLLWDTLESAFSGPEISAPALYGPASLIAGIGWPAPEISAPALYGPPVPKDERLAGYIALPIALGLSLVLWVVIVELVLMR